jgi:hypothetical protein
VREMTLFLILSLTLSQWSDLMTFVYVVKPRSTSDSMGKGNLVESMAINLGLVESYSSRVWNGLWKKRWWRQF